MQPPLQHPLHIRHVARLVQIVNIFAYHGLWSFAKHIGISKWLTPKQIRRAQKLAQKKKLALPDGELFAKGIRQSFEDLGPAFIKLGQLLATRGGLLPEVFIYELKKLHKHVKPVDFKSIHGFLQQEFTDEIFALFVKIQSEPIASGSIAQVHLATLSDRSTIALKIQRPKIEKFIRADLSLMNFFATILPKYFPEIRSLRLVLIIEELSNGLRHELDFVREAANTSRIAKNFKNYPEIVVPKIYWEYTTSKVLAMSYLSGCSSWNRKKLLAAGLQPRQFVKHGVHMFMKMVYIDGLFHGDLHPGNLLALKGNRLGVLDFGLTVKLSHHTREKLALIFGALLEENYELVCQQLIQLTEQNEPLDLRAFQHDIANAIAPYRELNLKGLSSEKIFRELIVISAVHGIHLPRELVVFLKTISSFEGIGVELDPDFDILSVAKKFSYRVKKTIYNPNQLKQQSFIFFQDLSQLIKQAPYRLNTLLRSIATGRLHIHVTSNLEDLSEAFDRAISRLAISLIIGSLIIASSIITFAGIGSKDSPSSFGLLGFALAGILGIYVIWSIIRSK